MKFLLNLFFGKKCPVCKTRSIDHKSNKAVLKIEKENPSKSIAALRKEISAIKKQASSFKAKEPFSIFLADYKSARSK